MFIVTGTFSSTSGACAPLVIIVQYLFLVAIAWSVCASVTLYDKIVNALKSYGKVDKHYFLKCLLGCWTSPLLLTIGTYITASTLGIDETPYITRTALIGDEQADTCWVGSPWKWVGFMIPIYLCIVLNIVLFVMVARIIIKAGKSGSSHGHAREFKALLSISATMTNRTMFSTIHRYIGIMKPTYFHGDPTQQVSACSS